MTIMRMSKVSMDEKWPRNESDEKRKATDENCGVYTPMSGKKDNDACKGLTLQD